MDLQKHSGGNVTRGPLPEGQGRLGPAPMITSSHVEEPLPRLPHLPRILSFRKGQEPEPAIGWLLLEGLWGELHLQETHRPQLEDLSCLTRAHPALKGELGLPSEGGIWPARVHFLLSLSRAVRASENSYN